MAVTLTSDWAAGVLINYVTAEIRTLEPILQLTRLGVQRDVPKGFHQLAFPQTSQIATSSVSTISEGVNPASTTWGSTAYTSGITQYGKSILNILGRLKIYFNLYFTHVSFAL